MSLVLDFLNENFEKENFLVNTELSEFTHTKIGGKADFIVFPKDITELQNLIRFCYTNNIKKTILGNASNVLISQEGISGVVVILTKLKAIKLLSDKDSLQILCSAGDSLIEVSNFATDNELSGLEFACGIPGSVGGAVYMNAGAYGGEIKDVFFSAIAVDEKGDIFKLSKEDMNFSYRTSSLQNNKFTIVSVVFNMKKGSYEEIKSKTDEFTLLRESKQPLEYPSCGSVFKRPEGFYAGKLIQDSGLQGFKIGGAQVSEKHAGFIVNVDNATSDDYLSLISHVQKTVFERFGVNLEREVRILT